jgi:hypothetical protein
MYYYVIQDANNKDSTTISNSLLIFGEHPRELISPELAVFMIKSLCSSNSIYVSNTISKILSQNRIIFVPLTNTTGRKIVEGGNYCKRTNEHGVDINRNYDVEFKIIDDPEQNAGPKPFSEWETRSIKRLMEKYTPKTFITVHSGVLGMYIPFAYRKVDKEDFNSASSKYPEMYNMMNILNTSNKKYCNCESGPAANELWYLCPGTCLDYAFKEVHKIKYSYAFEIFSNAALETNKLFGDIINSDTPFVFNYQNYIDQVKAKDKKTTGKERFNSLFLQNKMKIIGSGSLNDESEPVYNENQYGSYNKDYSCFTQVQTTSSNMDTDPTPEENNNCLTTFNPLTKRHFDNTLINWTNVIFQMLSDIYLKDNSEDTKYLDL